jgi:hypothetical protein
MLPGFSDGILFSSSACSSALLHSDPGITHNIIVVAADFG